MQSSSVSWRGVWFPASGGRPIVRILLMIGCSGRSLVRHEEMIPDESNIIDCHGAPTLDDEYARDHFLGKSLDDAFKMFCQSNNHIYPEDFQSLSDLAVRYYLPAVIKYAESEESKEEYLFIGWMASSLAFRLRKGTISHETAALARCFAVTVLQCPEKYDLMTEDGDEHETASLESLRYIRDIA